MLWLEPIWFSVQMLAQISADYWLELVGSAAAVYYARQQATEQHATPAGFFGSLVALILGAVVGAVLAGALIDALDVTSLKAQSAARLVGGALSLVTLKAAYQAAPDWLKTWAGRFTGGGQSGPRPPEGTK